MREFLDFQPASQLCFSNLSSFFFQVLEAGKSAEVDYDVIALRFLQFVPESGRVFERSQHIIKRSLTEPELMDFFSTVQDNLKLNCTCLPHTTFYLKFLTKLYYMHWCVTF